MPSSVIPKSKLIYQFGNGTDKHLVINKEAVKVDGMTELKTVYDDSSNLFHGATRLNVGDKNFKKAQQWSVEFTIGKYTDFIVGGLNDINIDIVNSVLHDRDKFLFFYSLDHSGNVERIYYTLADCIKTPNETETFRNNLDRGELLPTIEFLATPFLWQVDLNLVDVIDYANFEGGKQFYNTGLDYNTGLTYNFSGGGQYLASSLSQADLNLYIKNWNPNFFLRMQDRFFDRVTNSVNTTNAIINTTLTTNTNTVVSTTTALQNTTADNFIYLIELGQMLQNETIEILNFGNNSGWKLTWLSGSASPTNITYNSYYDAVYNTATGAILTQDQVRIEALGNKPLYFSPLAQTQPFTVVTNESINFLKNTAGNLTVKIEALKTFH